jgi:transcription elongation GreA/GreB family factor
MEKERIKQIEQFAKEFCDKHIHFDYKKQGDFIPWAVLFIEDLINNKTLISMDEVSKLKVGFGARKDIELKESTVSSAGKEVTDYEIKEQALTLHMLYMQDGDIRSKLIDMGRWVREKFKATPAKEITDQEIEEAADDHAQGRFVDHVRDSFEAFKEGAKWYQSQLKAKQ